jgi:hypothetical protein
MSSQKMLRHKRLKKVIVADTYLANEKSIGSYHCSQVFYGMNSKMLYVAGMKRKLNQSFLMYT